MYAIISTSLTLQSDLKVAPAKRIMSLKDPTVKMSKSHADPRTRILLNDSTKDIETKVRLALTDSLTNLGITYDPERRPGVANLLSLMSYLDQQGRSCQDLAQQHQNMSMREFKNVVVSTIDDALDPIRDRFLHLMTDGHDYLDEVAQKGAAKAKIELKALFRP